MAGKKTNLAVVDEKTTEKEYRSFEGTHNGVSGTFAIFEASVDDVEEADYQYSETFNRCIRRKNSIPSEAKMLQALQDSGEWPKKKEERLSELDVLISEQREKLLEIRKIESPNKTDKKEAKDLAEEIKVNREEMVTIRTDRTQYLTHTAEGKSEDSRRNYIIFASLKKVTSYTEGDKKKEKLGLRVWEDYQAYREDKDLGFKAQAYIQYISFISGGGVDFLSSLAEEQKNPWD